MRKLALTSLGAVVVAVAVVVATNFGIAGPQSPPKVQVVHRAQTVHKIVAPPQQPAQSTTATTATTTSTPTTTTTAEQPTAVPAVQQTSLPYCDAVHVGTPCADPNLPSHPAHNCPSSAPYVYSQHECVPLSHPINPPPPPAPSSPADCPNEAFVSQNGVSQCVPYSQLPTSGPGGCPPGDTSVSGAGTHGTDACMTWAQVQQYLKSTPNHSSNCIYLIPDPYQQKPPCPQDKKSKP